MALSLELDDRLHFTFTFAFTSDLRNYLININ